MSTDDIESHKRFAENHNLSFPLLADTDGAIARSFGVDTTGGYARRTTFIIGADGTIARVFPNVRVAGHTEAVLAEVKRILGEK